MKERNYGIDLLRIVAMFFICILHICGQAGAMLRVSGYTGSYYACWFLETAAYCAVDIYGLISGFAGVDAKHRPSRLAELWLRVFWYSALGSFLAVRVFHFELLEAGVYDEAIPLLFEAAGEGSARALSGLGYCYYRGYGVEENNEEAVKWFRLAAKQGIADAQYYLGMCLYYGWGTAQDDAEAAAYFRQAAEQGDARGQYYLGNCCYLGRGTEQNEAEAVKWFRLSAEQEYARAMYSLGYMVYTGSGTVKDEAAGKEWIRKALDAGVKLSEEEQARAEELLGGEDAQ